MTVLINMSETATTTVPLPTWIMTGKDEFITGALCMEVNDDNEFRPKWCTYLQHGDALHIGNYDPTHTGFEFFTVHEDSGTNSLSGNDITLISVCLLLTPKQAILCSTKVRPPTQAAVLWQMSVPADTIKFECKKLCKTVKRRH